MSRFSMEAADGTVRRSRSAAVLCRSRWKRDAKRRGVWSRTRFASRERERTHALQDAAALILDRMAAGAGVCGSYLQQMKSQCRAHVVAVLCNLPLYRHEAKVTGFVWCGLRDR